MNIQGATVTINSVLASEGSAVFLKKNTPLEINVVADDKSVVKITVWLLKIAINNAASDYTSFVSEPLDSVRHTQVSYLEPNVPLSVTEYSDAWSRGTMHSDTNEWVISDNLAVRRVLSNILRDYCHGLNQCVILMFLTADFWKRNKQIV